MVNDLFRAVTKFYKLSQDPLAPVKVAIEGALAELVNSKAISINTVSLIGNDVKVDVQLHPTAGDNSGSSGGLNQSYLQNLVSGAVAKVNPTLKTLVTINMSTESALPRTAQLRKNFAKFHKLADCAPGDPLCDGMDPNLPPDGLEGKVQAIILTELKKNGFTMSGFFFRQDNKQVLVTVTAPKGKKVSAQQVGTILTQKISAVAPGFAVVVTLAAT